MSTKKHYELKLSRLQAFLSLFALIGCTVAVFTLGIFMGRTLFQSPSPPPARQTILPDNSVADYGTFESLNTAAAESAKTASSQFSFYEKLPQNDVAAPRPKEETNQNRALPPPSSKSTPGRAQQPESAFGAVIYTIQVAAFRQQDKAYALADKLTRLGYPARVVNTTDAKGSAWHRVRVGRFNTPEEARRLLPALGEISSAPQIIPAEG